MESVLKMSADVARVATDAGANSKEGYKEAARIAQETNEKSMDAMQKVAVAAAAGVAATTRKESKRDKDSFACNSCGKSHDERKKFCPHCGSAQSPSEP
jgi:rRNA maturation endonuclease Nob1